MPAGKPMKFSSPEQLEGLPDWEVEITSRNFKNNDFKKEKDLVKYITDNVDKFVLMQFNDKVVSYEVDKPVNRQSFWPRGRRVDLFIQWENWIYIIECKNAKNSIDIRSWIGQLLDYWREYLDPKKELVLIANMYDENTAKTIIFYNLPIRYIIISKLNSIEYVWKA